MLLVTALSPLLLCCTVGTSLLEFKQTPEEAGIAAAYELLANIGAHHVGIYAAVFLESLLSSTGCFRVLFPDHGGCTDEYLQDQLLIFMALAAGERIRPVYNVSFHRT